MSADDDTVDLFRRVTLSRLTNRDRDLRDDLQQIVADQEERWVLETEATFEMLGRRGEVELIESTSLLIEAAKELLKDSPIAALEANARACKNVVETIIASSYDKVWRSITTISSLREILSQMASNATAMQWRLADVRNEQTDRATVEVDLLVRSRLANRPLSVSESPRRRIAVIVSVDVVSYSNLMEHDEAGTARKILELQVLAKELANEHFGRVFNTAGDAVMLEFPSATDAVEAGHALSDRSSLAIRVGIHVAEVAGEGDLLAHAVNVAARLMQAAEPNQVLVSGDVRRLVRGPMRDVLWEVATISMKNIEEPIDAFAMDPLPD